MKIYPVCILVLFLFACNVQAITISEIMPNPSDDCNDCSEWIEIYNVKNIELNLSEWMISDENNNDTLVSENSMTTNSSYFIIIGEDSNISEITESEVVYFRTTNGKIGNGLRNNGENITIYNSTSVIDYTSYPDFSDREGYSWSRAENGSWFYCDSPTPGEPNFLTNTSVNQTDGNQTNATDETCDLSLSIISDLISISGEKQNYYLVVEDKNCDQEEKEVSIEYWIEDLFGEMIKSEYTTTKSMICHKNISRQWTPNGIEGSEAFHIKARISEAKCNDSDPSNDLAEKIVIVKGEKTGSDECPPCEIKETVCSCGPCPKCTAEDEEEKEEDFKIISYPEEVGKDEEIEIKIEIRNTQNQPRNYTVYSYVYEGKKILSTGFDGNSWFNTWDANKQNISIPKESLINLTLKNRIAEDTKSGKYKLRVRIWLEGKKNDITRDINILPAKESELNMTEENETTDISDVTNETGEVWATTGRIISKREENWFYDFIENVINFFKNLFNL